MSAARSVDWKEIIELYVALKKDLSHMNNQLQKVESALKCKCRTGDFVVAGYTLAVRTRSINGTRVEFLIIDGERQ